MWKISFEESDSVLIRSSSSMVPTGVVRTVFVPLSLKDMWGRSKERMIMNPGTVHIYVFCQPADI